MGKPTQKCISLIDPFSDDDHDPIITLPWSIERFSLFLLTTLLHCILHLREFRPCRVSSRIAWKFISVYTCQVCRTGTRYTSPTCNYSSFIFISFDSYTDRVVCSSHKSDQNKESCLFVKQHSFYFYAFVFMFIYPKILRKWASGSWIISQVSFGRGRESEYVSIISQTTRDYAYPPAYGRVWFWHRNSITRRSGEICTSRVFVMCSVSGWVSIVLGWLVCRRRWREMKVGESVTAWSEVNQSDPHSLNGWIDIWPSTL